MANANEQTTQLSEVLYLIKKVESVNIPADLKEKIDVKLKRLRRMARQGQMSGEYESVAKYIDWCIRVPWFRYNQDNLNLNNAKKVMDSMHYSHEETKQVILEYLAILNRKTQLQNQEYISPVLAFVGVQGAGKTSLAKAIAASLGRPFYRISMGALGSGKELRGSPAESEAGEPGQIIKSLANCGSMNPVILLDEFDKLSGSEEVRADFMAILLELLDPQQNKTFRDHYIDYPIDLSKILFIATANKFRTVSRELLDRLEVIQFEDYNANEKAVIAKRYLYPEVLNYAGLQPQEFQIAEDAWPVIIDIFGRDPGVRRLERNLQRLARKVTKKIVMGETQSVTLTPQLAKQYAEEALPSIEKIRDLDYTAHKQKSKVQKEAENKGNESSENSSKQKVSESKTNTPPNQTAAPTSSHTTSAANTESQNSVTPATTDKPPETNTSNDNTATKAPTPAQTTQPQTDNMSSPQAQAQQPAATSSTSNTTSSRQNENNTNMPQTDLTQKGSF